MIAFVPSIYSLVTSSPHGTILGHSWPFIFLNYFLAELSLFCREQLPIRCVSLRIDRPPSAVADCALSPVHRCERSQPSHAVAALPRDAVIFSPRSPGPSHAIAALPRDAAIFSPITTSFSPIAPLFRSPILAFFALTFSQASCKEQIQHSAKCLRFR